MLVFIDKSGDPGFKVGRGSTAVFVMALVAFKTADEGIVTRDAIDALAKRLRIGGEFKFSGSRPEVRDAFFACISPCSFCVRAIVVRKELIYSNILRADKERFYSFFVKSMLSFDNGLLKNARVIIDGSGDLEFKRELKAYLRRYLETGSLESIKFKNSTNDRLVQLADMCVGAIARSYRRDRSDANRWRSMLEPKIENVWPFR
jgi:hypothetical protein